MVPASGTVRRKCRLRTVMYWLPSEIPASGIRSQSKWSEGLSLLYSRLRNPSAPPPYPGAFPCIPHNHDSSSALQSPLPSRGCRSVTEIFFPLLPVCLHYNTKDRGNPALCLCTASFTVICYSVCNRDSFSDGNLGFHLKR